MAWMQGLRKSKSLQYGLPMMILIVGGSFGLREFAQIRYDIQKIRGKMDPELEKKLKKRKVTLEEEYEGLPRFELGISFS
ncbi:cytochrome c oxidase assembly protein COX16 homolog, mitochondrial isoform X2 [Thamnophis elegans]|uniref:cytochrome c oxidase assembly protein COX16 homolog, mitochondrial isoform X2 n=1 Tax=Thamnophis elegans TaxID=35005 RepID=UPI001378C114|nr:cytochrome c oxidase assembly protein COX16 homolog, mitochondrial isoform X2 [Thamnophis elegans]